MTVPREPEYWLRGPVPGIHTHLQPVAHALLQARSEVLELMDSFPENLMWQQPAGMASPAFHLQHMAGVINRLLTYARGEPLTPSQLQYLRSEGVFHTGITVATLLQGLTVEVDIALEQLAHTHADHLAMPRSVGRAQLPSTVLGLLVHAAEHTMRHTGQLLVTAQFLRKGI